MKSQPEKLLKKNNPQGLKENIEVAKRGGKVANNARFDLEREIDKSVITKNNVLNYQYKDEDKLIENK